MKYGKNDTEWESSIQGMSLRGIIWGKEEEALNT